MWEKVFELLPGRACSIFMVRLQKMMKETGASPDCIPQMEDVSNFLKRKIYLLKTTITIFIISKIYF